MSCECVVLLQIRERESINSFCKVKQQRCGSFYLRLYYIYCVVVCTCYSKRSWQNENTRQRRRHTANVPNIYTSLCARSTFYSPHRLPLRYKHAQHNICTRRTQAKERKKISCAKLWSRLLCIWKKRQSSAAARRPVSCSTAQQQCHTLAYICITHAVDLISPQSSRRTVCVCV